MIETQTYIAGLGLQTVPIILQASVSKYAITYGSITDKAFLRQLISVASHKIGNGMQGIALCGTAVAETEADTSESRSMLGSV